MKLIAMDKMKTKLFYLIVLITVLSGCVKIGEFYAGLNMQPDMSDSPFVPGLNVYGIVKAGVSLDSVNHHFEVQKLMDLSNWSEETEVHNALLLLERTSLETVNEEYILNHKIDAIYEHTNMVVAPGDFWQFTCVYDTFMLYASCVVPMEPIVEEKTIDLDQNRLFLKIAPDTTAFMYMLYLLSGEHLYQYQSLAGHNTSTELEVFPDWGIPASGAEVYLFAVDENLRKYSTTSNTFFKPNAYRPGFSTIDGGFGVFGAVTGVMIEIESK